MFGHRVLYTATIFDRGGLCLTQEQQQEDDWVVMDVHELDTGFARSEVRVVFPPKLDEKGDLEARLPLWDRPTSRDKNEITYKYHIDENEIRRAKKVLRNGALVRCRIVEATDGILYAVDIETLVGPALKMWEAAEVIVGKNQDNVW